MSKEQLYNDNNNFTQSIFRSWCEFVSWPSVFFSSGATVPWKQTSVQKRSSPNFTQSPQKRWCAVIIV